MPRKSAAQARRYAQSLSPSEDREKDDFYPTPAEATRALLAFEDFGDVWEPACGDGAISKVLEETGHNVVSTDLVDRGYGESHVDFLMERRLLAPSIITNPPFKLGKQFLCHALELGAEKVALLLRLAWLEGVARKQLFESTPLARVLVSSRRLSLGRSGTDFGEGGGGMIAFAWFVWDVSHEGPTELRWFDWEELP